MDKRHFFAQARASELGIGKNGRSSEQDALTIFDEGGTIKIRSQSETDFFIFGHGAYECLHYQVQNFSRACIELDSMIDDPSMSIEVRRSWVDDTLSLKLENPGLLKSPREMVGFPCSELMRQCF